MNRTVGFLHAVFATGVAVATFAAVFQLFARAGASLLEDLHILFGILALGALLELVGFVLLEGYAALRRRD